MKKKILNTVIDIILIAVAYAVTDILMLKVFHSESMWLELLCYVVLYGILFGGKWAITKLWMRSVAAKKPEVED